MVRIHRGADPDLMVRLPDGRHAAIAMSLANYAGVTAPPATASSALLALAGLRQMVRLLEQWRQERQYDTDSST